jgi:hypothetical protein
MIVTDWLAKLLGLSDVFLNSDAGAGGGIIQCTASDATFVAMLAARTRAVNRYANGDDASTWIDWILKRLFNHTSSIFSRLVAYCSDQVCLLEFTE